MQRRRLDPQHWVGEYWTIDGTTSAGQNVQLLFGLDDWGGIIMQGVKRP
jgi:hypothetical protein